MTLFQIFYLNIALCVCFCASLFLLAKSNSAAEKAAGENISAEND